VLNPVGEELWTVEGPIVSFYSFPYPTRMAVARLANRQLWLWSPIALTSESAEELMVAHGPIIRENAKDVIASSLAWIG
jgi:hypothetical protein